METQAAMMARPMTANAMNLRLLSLCTLAGPWWRTFGEPDVRTTHSETRRLTSIIHRTSNCIRQIDQHTEETVCAIDETHAEREPEHDLVRDDVVRDRAERLPGDFVDPEHAAGRHEEPAMQGCGEQEHELRAETPVSAWWKAKGRSSGPCTCA